MPTIEVAAVIAAHPMDVSAVLLDPEAAPLWTSGLKRFEVIEGDPGRAGAVAHAHYREHGRDSVLEDRLLVAIPGERFASEITGNGLVAHVDTTLDACDDGTLVTIRWNGHGVSRLTTVMLWLLRHTIRRRSQQDLEALKTIVEARNQAAGRPS